VGDEGLLRRVPGRALMTSREQDASPRVGVDRPAMERAVAEFLRAAGAALDDPELRDTPSRVTTAWADEFLDGYRGTIEEALGPLSPAPEGGGLICVTHLDFTGICPHHLLPYPGVAHIAYQPGKLIAGFGRFAALVDTLAHRLTLQETLARQIVDALVGTLGASGAAVVVQAEQSCMTLRGERRTRSRTSVEATAGLFDSAALARLWAAIQADGRSRPEFP
jgi:GTP cyclohydrolase I